MFLTLRHIYHCHYCFNKDWMTIGMYWPKINADSEIVKSLSSLLGTGWSQGRKSYSELNKLSAFNTIKLKLTQTTANTLNRPRVYHRKVLVAAYLTVENLRLYFPPLCMIAG